MLQVKYDKMTAEEEVAIFKLLADEGISDKDKIKAQHEIVERNLYLVRFAVSKFYKAIPDKQDIFQEGSRGLYPALEKFKPEMGNRFSTYALWWIRQSINQSLSNTSRTVRAPAYVIDAVSKINKKKEELSRINGKPPSDEEVAEALELDINKYHKYINALEAVSSLDHKIGEDSTMIDVIENTNAPNPETLQITQDLNAKLSDVLIRTLLPREEYIIRARMGLGFAEEMTLEEIGNTMNLTKERVRQIEKTAFQKLESSKLLKAFKNANYD